MNISRWIIIFAKITLILAFDAFLLWIIIYFQIDSLSVPALFLILGSISFMMLSFVQDDIHIHFWTKWKKGKSVNGSTCESRECKSCHSSEYRGHHSYVESVDPLCPCTTTFKCPACGHSYSTTLHDWQKTDIDTCVYRKDCIRCGLSEFFEDHSFEEYFYDYNTNYQQCIKCGTVK